MLPAINRTIGMNIGFPDPCLTPSVPAPIMLPYPNFAMHGQCIVFALNVRITGAPALHMGSKIPITIGDDAGVAHPFFKQIGQFTAGNPLVRVNFLPGICLLCPTTGNNMNNGAGAVLVPPVVNVFFTYNAARGGAEGAVSSFDCAMSSDDVAALAEDLASAGRPGDPPVSTSMDGQTGTLRIRVFSADVPARAFAAIEALSRAGMERLVIDLRDNPGGDLQACAALLGDFLPSGTLLFTAVDSEGDETVHRGFCENPWTFDVTVRVNGGTASAAELFAAALEAHGRSTVEGGPMFGKDTLQKVVVLPDGSARRVTVGRWRAPERSV